MPEQLSAARRAGRLVGRRRRKSHIRLEWPELRAEILNRGGIGPSPDYDNSDWGDLGLYRERGRPPDIVAQETFIGRADRPPWQGTEETGGDDRAMLAYLQRAREEYRDATPEERKYSRAALPRGQLERRRALRSAAEGARLQQFGTRRASTAEEQREHAQRMRAFIERARAARRAKYSRPARGFYTDPEGEVHPITGARRRTA